MMSANSSFILSTLALSASFHKKASLSSEASIDRARARSFPLWNWSQSLSFVNLTICYIISCISDWLFFITFILMGLIERQIYKTIRIIARENLRGNCIVTYFSSSAKYHNVLLYFFIIPVFWITKLGICFNLQFLYLSKLRTLNL